MRHAPSTDGGAAAWFQRSCLGVLPGGGGGVSVNPRTDAPLRAVPITSSGAFTLS
jgi:hypothetical protein